MEQQKQLHANAYAHWEEEDDKKLTEYYQQGLSTSEIASLMNRNRGGISSRIKKLGLKDALELKAVSAAPDDNDRKKLVPLSFALR